LLGAILGAANSLILLTAVTLFFTFFPSSFFIGQIYEKSLTGNYIARSLVFLHKNILPVIGEGVNFDGERFLGEIDMRLEQVDSHQKKEV